LTKLSGRRVSERTKGVLPEARARVPSEATVRRSVERAARRSAEVSLCRLVLTPVILVIRQIVEVIREVVRTVCEWVRGVIHTVKTIVEEVCSWLPWPLDAICDLVTTVIDVIEEVWNWVCREVLERVVDFIETVVEYVIYVLKWVCWIVAWPVRGVQLLLCRLGFRPRVRVHICIRVLTDAEGSPTVPWSRVRRDIREASQILEACNIELVPISAERVEQPAFISGLTCDVAGLFSRAWTWFSANECLSCAALTLYYVDDIAGAYGCSYPGSDWILVARDGDAGSIVHELGHLSDLWGHSDDPENVMHAPSGTKLTPGQCCMIRTSRFAAGVQRCPGTERVELPEDEGPADSRDDAGEGRPAPAPDTLPCPGFRNLHQPGTRATRFAMIRAVHAAVALGIVAAAVRRVVRRH
jgi:hypothetical protein